MRLFASLLLLCIVHIGWAGVKNPIIHADFSDPDVILHAGMFAEGGGEFYVDAFRQSL